MTEQLPARVSINSEDQMHDFGKRLGLLLRKGNLISLIGPLGAGKTTLTRGIGEGLGVQGTIASPTFLIARTHQTSSGIPFVHIDAYRLSSARELDDLDIDFNESIAVVEWGKGYAEGITDSWLEIEIAIDRESEVRTLTLRAFGSLKEQVAES